MFTIDELAMGDYDWDSLLEMNTNSCKWSYKLLVDVISHQKATLRELRIGQIGPENLAGFNVNEFTTLEVLQINRTGLPTPEAACDSWALPNLKKLVLECSYNDSQHGPVPYFTSEVSIWLKKFAELAVARTRDGSSALAEIEILYYERDDYREIGMYPRQLIVETERHIRDLGLVASTTYTARYPELE